MTDRVLHYEDAGAEITKVVVGPADNNVFVLRCIETDDAVLVDAADEPNRLLEMSSRLGVTKVLETHTHRDHTQAVPAMRAAGYPVGVTQADAHMLSGYDFVIGDDELIEVGRLQLRSIFTPGHTPGSVCFRLVGAPVLFAGDTLFPGGPGATHRPGGDFEAIIASITGRLFATLDDDVIVMPGHGDDTTIGTERPHLQDWMDRGW